MMSLLYYCYFPLFLCFNFNTNFLLSGEDPDLKVLTKKYSCKAKAKATYKSRFMPFQLKYNSVYWNENRQEANKSRSIENIWYGVDTQLRAEMRPFRIKTSFQNEYDRWQSDVRRLGGGTLKILTEDYRYVNDLKVMCLRASYTSNEDEKTKVICSYILIQDQKSLRLDVLASKEMAKKEAKRILHFMNGLMINQ